MLGTFLERSVPRHGLTYRGDEKQTTQDNKDSLESGSSGEELLHG